jgi:hypothetical protein
MPGFVPNPPDLRGHGNRAIKRKTISILPRHSVPLLDNKNAHWRDAVGAKFRVCSAYRPEGAG